MVTKEQAFEALNRVQNGISDGWQSFDVVRRFIEHSQPVPDEFVLVPVEPTEEMLKDAQKARCCYADFEHFMDHEGAEIKTDWRAMLAAAPKPDDQ